MQRLEVLNETLLDVEDARGGIVEQDEDQSVSDDPQEEEDSELSDEAE